MDLLQCTRCGESKPPSSFHKDASKGRGFTYDCRSCTSNRMKQYSQSRKKFKCDCGAAIRRKGGKCIACTNADRTGTGSVITHRRGYRQRRVNGKYVMEHRIVMEEMLGRKLLPGENVHHKNGVKSDNRPDNLELWVTYQPSGQRPEDLLEWADEIIRRYRQ